METNNLTTLGTETAKVLNQHIKTVESTHPNVNDCQLSITNKGSQFIAKIKGRFKKEFISGEATDRVPVTAYVKAHKNFCRDIDRVRTKKKIEDAMSDFAITY